MTNFTDKVVWVTGASSGIGEALALEFAREGARLVLSSRREDELERVKKSTQLPDERVMVLPMDVTQFELADSMAAKIIEKFGRIDIMVHNAGISQRSTVLDTSMEVYRKILDVDFLSTVALTKAVLPGMVRQQSGQFIVISSVTGKLGTPMRSGYAAAKHALYGFYDSLRAEVHDDNVHVLMVCPGYIRTQISVNALDSKGGKHGKMDQNQAQGMSPEECARKILQSVEKGKKEVYIGGLKEGAAIFLRKFWPELLFKQVRKNAPK